MTLISVLRGLVAISFASVVLSSVGVKAASFDCQKSTSHIEQVICQDPEMSSFDSELQGAYAGALDRSNHPDSVTSEQRAWLSERNACSDKQCLITKYQARITYLSKISDEPAICAGSSTPEVNACMAEYARRADRELARYLLAARKRIEDEAIDDPNQETSKTTLTAFDASQKAWELYRKAECDAIYDFWSEGTIRGAMYGGCMQSVTKARTEEIWGAWLSFEDNTPPLLPKPAEK